MCATWHGMQIALLPRMAATGRSTAERKLSEAMTFVVAATAALSACSGGSGATDGDGTRADGTTVFEDETEANEQLPPRLPAMATVDALPEPDPSFAGCLSIMSRRAGLGLEASVLLWTYDAAARVLAAVPSDEHGSSVDPTDPSQSHARYWKLDTAGRVVVRAGGGSGYRPFRQGVERDEQGNITAMRSVYVDAIDVHGELEGQSYSDAKFSNEYDTSGQLVEHIVLGEGGVTLARNDYIHDGAGRCEVITSAGETERVERRDYDSAGRLWHRYVEGQIAVPLSPDTARLNTVTTFQYDELGRLRSADSVGGPEASPMPEFSVTNRSDGSFVVQQNWVSDTNDTSSRTVWSRGCNELRALLTPDRHGGCATDYVLAGDTAF
jgi:hypothetical protein